MSAIQIIYAEPTISEYVADLALIEFWLKATRQPSVRSVDAACHELAMIARGEAERRELAYTIEALEYIPF